MYEGLVLTSGSIKGFLILGFLDYIYADISSVKYYCGCSIGSHLCMLLSIGYTPLEIITYLCTNDVSQLFKDLNPIMFKDFYGMIDVNIMINYIEEMIKYKIGYIPTFKDLYDNYDKILICPAYNITDNKKEYLSVETYPDMLISKACILSSNIPFLFSKVEHNGKYYIDGAFFDAFPLNKLSEYTKELNCKILGVNINHKKEEKIDSFFSYIKTMISCLTENTYNVEDNVTLRTLDFDYEEIDFNVDTKVKIKMYVDGYNQSKKIKVSSIDKSIKEC